MQRAATPQLESLNKEDEALVNIEAVVQVAKHCWTGGKQFACGHSKVRKISSIRCDVRAKQIIQGL